MYKLKNNKLTNLLGSVCSIMLLALAFLVISPNVMEAANAEGEVATGGVNARLAVVANPMIAIGLSANTLNYNFTPRSEAEFQTQPTTLTVQTNNTDGYTIYMETSSGKLSNGASGTISSIVGNNIASENFPINTWGYSIDSNNYNAIPTANTAIKPVPGQVATGSAVNYQLKFGVSINSSLPAGTYTGDVIISAVANPIKITNMMQLTNLQDMTHELCQNTMGTDGNPVTIGNEPSIQLKDTRDNKWYYVSKLADGNCWMTQNLDLDIPATGLKAVDTDIEADWTNPSGATIKTSNFTDGYSDTTSYSWDLGNYKLSLANSTVSCSLYNGNDIATECNDAVSAFDSLSSESVKNNLEAHYHIGNYYQLNTATAGKNNTASLGNVNESICPKNWTLPKASGTDSYGKLAEAYGISAASGTISEAEVSQLTSTPLYFTRSGYITPQEQYLYHLGDYAYIWLGTTLSTNKANFFMLSTAGAFEPSAEGYYYVVRSVRCLAR